MAAYAVTIITICCFFALLAPVLALTCISRKKQPERSGPRTPTVWHGRTYQDVEGGYASGIGGTKDADMAILVGTGVLLASTAIIASLDGGGGGGGCGGGI